MYIYAKIDFNCPSISTTLHLPEWRSAISMKFRNDGVSSLDLVTLEFQIGVVTLRPHKEIRRDRQSFVKFPVETMWPLNARKTIALRNSKCVHFLGKDLCTSFAGRTLLIVQNDEAYSEFIHLVQRSYVTKQGVGNKKTTRYNSIDCDISWQQSRALGPVILLNRN